MLEPTTRENRIASNIYGDLSNDNEFIVIQNPYYGGNPEMDSENAKGNVTDLNNTEIVTVCENIYYDI